MRYILAHLKPRRGLLALVMTLKLSATLLELLIPYVMEHLIDHAVPAGLLGTVLLWGAVMLFLAFLVRTLNVMANRRAVRVARDAIYDIRLELFHAGLNLSGAQMDGVGLPSLISRMTTDTYNVQSFIQSIQTIGVRAPIMLLGGILVTLIMDRGLALILCVMAPVMIALVVTISRRGIPLYDRVQRGMDDIVRIMRENITGIRVVKALSKEPYETERFARVNDETARRDIRAGVTMALPGPIVTLFLNVGLTLVILIGARRVNAGQTAPGVILAFLTYFNMILMGVMGLNRVFMMLSKANASASRIALVTEMPDDLPRAKDAPECPREGYIVFDHVSFNYPGAETAAGPDGAKERFAGSVRQRCLTDIDFTVRRGGSLGIIGATGSGKTTIVNLLMRFYDPDEGRVYVDGRDVRAWDRDDLRRRFGAVFQNDAIFADTIRENVVFGRDMTEEMLENALSDAMAAGFVDRYPEGVDHEAAIHGGNFSGGQRQRLLIARALGVMPDILVLDDASSALDYRTDAQLRRNLAARHADATLVVIAQRVSSIMGMDEILVLDEGRIIGRGTHEALLDGCPAYREIYETQMGEVG